MAVVGLPSDRCGMSTLDSTLDVLVKSLRLEVGEVVATVVCIPTVF